jgi:hypothetical protein
MGGSLCNVCLALDTPEWISRTLPDPSYLYTFYTLNKNYLKTLHHCVRKTILVTSPITVSHSSHTNIIINKLCYAGTHGNTSLKIALCRQKGKFIGL